MVQNHQAPNHSLTKTAKWCGLALLGLGKWRLLWCILPIGSFQLGDTTMAWAIQHSVQVQCILAHCPAESEWERVLQHLVRLDPLTQLHSLSNIYSCLFIKSIHGNCWKFPSFSRSLLHLLPETQETRGALLTLGLHQQLLESDQLSAMYTLSKGGGWRGDWLRSGRWQFTGLATTTWTSLWNQDVDIIFFCLGMKVFWKRRGNISDISTFRIGVITLVTYVAGMRRKFSLILPATREGDKRGEWGTIASSTSAGGFRECRCYLSTTSVGNDVWLGFDFGQIRLCKVHSLCFDWCTTITYYCTE